MDADYEYSRGQSNELSKGGNGAIAVLQGLVKRGFRTEARAGDRGN